MEDNLSLLEKLAIFIYYSLFAFASGVWLIVVIPSELELYVAILVSAVLIMFSAYVRYLVHKARRKQKDTASPPFLYQ